MIEIRYASIRELDISNGEGIGCSIFVQGCPFHCYNCFNSNTWDFHGGKEWTEEIQQEFLNLISRSYIKRISILGGEPLAEQNLNEVLTLINKIKELFPQKKIWIYTGYKWEDIFISNIITKKGTKNDKWTEEKIKRKEIVSLCDVMIDGQYIDSQRDITLKWRGSSNQMVIDIKKSLKQQQLIMWDR